MRIVFYYSTRDILSEEKRMYTQAEINENIENFFIVNSAVREYRQTKSAITDAIKPPKKRVYRSMEKLLKECYFIGSLKYGNNFIA